ncbi:MAG: hypothetical protein EXQ48_05095 [Acidobacteria bacterium]|nr:hypothetical protein [Acidobacteriota bacterium]
MADRDAFAERGRTLEEDYFRRQEKEVIEKMRRGVEAEAQRRRLGDTAGVADEGVLADLQALGYTAETVMLLHLVPLIQMAWAEGSVSDQERGLIVQAARSRGVEAGSAADHQLGRWLSARPSDELFDKTLRAIRTILHARPAEEREASEQDILSLATAIAAASGGILGFGAVSEDEKPILARISQALDKGGKS